MGHGRFSAEVGGITIADWRTRHVEDLDQLRISRANARNHVAVGFGAHRCMGNRLAEMQLKILWEAIENRFERVEVVGQLVVNANKFIHGIAGLLVQSHRFSWNAGWKARED